MTMTLKLLDLCWLFADGAAGGAGGPGAGASGVGASPAAAAPARTSDQIAAEAGIRMPGSDRRAKQNITGGRPAAVNGKPADGARTQAPAAGEQGAGDAPGEKTPAQREQEFRALIDGEYKQAYKDLFTQESQRVINARFKETKQLQESLASHKPVIDLLMQRYGIADGDLPRLQHALEGDETFWSAAAEKAGMEEAAYREAMQLRQEKAAREQAQAAQHRQQAQEMQYNAWLREAGQIKNDYPGFNLSAECRSGQFVRMLKAGVPMKTAFEAVHGADLRRVAVQGAQQAAVEAIRAKGMRPDENGTSAQSGLYSRNDVRALTREERAKIARRAAGGEKIAF